MLYLLHMSRDLIVLFIKTTSTYFLLVKFCVDKLVWDLSYTNSSPFTSLCLIPKAYSKIQSCIDKLITKRFIFPTEIIKLLKAQLIIQRYWTLTPLCWWYIIQVFLNTKSITVDVFGRFLYIDEKNAKKKWN